MDQRERRLSLGMLLQRPERLGPGKAVTPGPERRHSGGRRRQPEVPEADAPRPRFDQPQRQQHERYPLDERGERPAGPGELAPAREGDRKRGEDEGERPGVVVPTAGEVDRQHGAPADHGPGESRPP